MLKQNKGKLILSSILVLSPMVVGLVLWDRLPALMATHWGADGAVDGWSGRGFAVFGMPLMMLAVHLLCLCLTMLDKGNWKQNPKAMGILFWIFPVISWVGCLTMYSAAMGMEFRGVMLVPILVGVLFVVMGNYLPKVRPNWTFGVKLPWTFGNEENWVKTHRFTGKVWVVTGLCLLFACFLPGDAGVVVTLLALLPAVLLPTLYSYCLYRRHLKAGILYTMPQSRAAQVGIRVTSVLILVVLALVAVLLTTGSVEAQLTEDALVLDSVYYSRQVISYDSMQSAEFRENLDFGYRASGFGSPKLSLGIFENAEFGTYLLYAYTAADSAVVIDCGGRTVVVALENTAATQALYDGLTQKIG